MSEIEVKVLDQNGAIESSIKIAEVKTNPMLVKQVYQSFHDSQRKAHAKTKKRGEVRGGGRKPWRQKGTGRARIGSTRAPHWIGGGRVFAPTGIENYKTSINLKDKKKAYRDALAGKVIAGNVLVIDSIPKTMKTKEANNFVKKLKLTGRVLLVFGGKDESIRAFRNIDKTTSKVMSTVNIKDIVDADKILLVGLAKNMLEFKK